MTSNGNIIINDNQVIRKPFKERINSYSIKDEKINFVINYHCISPVVKPYTIKLPNSISLKKEDVISIKINIPKQIYIENYVYSLENIIEDLYNDYNFCGQIKLKSNNKLYTISRCPFNNNELNVYDNNGWVTFKLTYKINEEKIDDLCEILYSIDFIPKKLVIVDNSFDTDKYDFKTELYLEIENGNYIEEKKDCKEVIVPFTDNLIKLKIIGPINFKCVHFEENDNFSIHFDESNKTLLIKGCLTFVKVDRLLINEIRDNNTNDKFYFYLLNENNNQLHSIYTNDLCKIKIDEGFYYTYKIDCNIIEDEITYGTIINKYDKEINNIIKAFTNADNDLLQVVHALTSGFNQLRADVDVHLPDDIDDICY